MRSRSRLRLTLSLVALGGWSVDYWDEQMGQVMGEAMTAPFDLVLGRKTYDIFAAYWPHATDNPAPSH